MHRPLLLRWSRWCSVAILLGASSAWADDKTDALIQQLRSSDDFRVRTQAALALGVTKDPVAVKPLCDALDDGHEAVRGASAAALAKLGRADGLPCLKDREGKENDGKVKAQIGKSIKALEAAAARAAGGSGDSAEVPANAKWYVSVGKITNKSSRSEGDLEPVIRSAITGKLRSYDRYGIAPRGESAAAAKKVMQGKGLKGFEFQVTVEPPAYDGDKLSITLRILITNYPGKDIKATLSPKISQTGVRKGDTATEDQLMRLLLEDSVQKFDKSVDSM